MARRTTLLASLTLALASATAACGDDASGPGDVETVEMRTGNTFFPPTLTIDAGTTVRWVNEDATAHNTTSNTAGLWASANLQPNGTFQRTFSNTGTFAYSCTIHPGMNGTIIVN